MAKLPRFPLILRILGTCLCAATLLTALHAQSPSSLDALERHFSKALGRSEHPVHFRAQQVGKFRLITEKLIEGQTPPPPAHQHSRARILKRLQTQLLSILPIPNPGSVKEGALDVIVLRSRARYDLYLKHLGPGTNSAIHGHFEPAALRIILPATASAKTLRHEATHLLMDAYRSKSVRSGVRVFWFEEGFAEYVAGIPNDSMNYRPGLDLPALRKALAPTRRSAKEGTKGAIPSPLTLRQLLDATLATSKGWNTNPTHSPHPNRVMHQASAFIRFLIQRQSNPNPTEALSAKRALSTYLGFQLHGLKGSAYNDRAAFRHAFSLTSTQAFAAFEREWKASWESLANPQNPKAPRSPKR